ncbi:hypothetical protein [Hwanghaeella sp. LZ110]|uniref:hypothetical protein n=1 Tax=Hwanghaeella sp. LZ110 TaxID=3402810 RepID=UPI003B6803AF
MTNPFPNFSGPQGGGGESGPPGQNALGILLAGCVAFFVTPYVFEWIGPFVERLVLNAYGSRELADLMYWLSFGLIGGVLFTAARLFFWYVLAAFVAYMAQRAVMGSMAF